MSKKYNVLAWGDSATAGTGFGTVSRMILSAIWNTGKYNIDHLAINFNGDFKNANAVPWTVQPSKLLNPRDLHGIEMFKKVAKEGNYDLIWILNDIYVTHRAAEGIKEIRDVYISSGRKPPVIVYYYPIDCHCSSWATGMLEAVDCAVCYTKHGREETLKTLPHIEKKLMQIPHGVDNEDFSPVSRIEIAELKKQFWRATEETKIILNVNRNSVRKQVPYTIAAFKEYKKYYPQSILYLHMQLQDQGGNLAKTIIDSGLKMNVDVMLPANFSPANPLPTRTLANIYAAADVFVTTHLGEGWGLTITESMAAGTPVVAPRNTCMPQQLGENSERGYMYDCKDVAVVDDSGYRLKGLIPDIVEQMVQATKDGKVGNPKVKAALEFARQHDWGKIGQKWVDLFQKALAVREKSTINLAEEI
jgi:glycosyltransferase involved in cell wall biosynthesis